MNNEKICLVIIFNHRYDKNIEKLRKIYKDRFSNIKFLMPFYDGDDKDVIPVWEHSFQFQGYFAQAYDRLIKEDADYYLFAADDLILNAKINEKNLIENLNLKSKDIFSIEVKPLNKKGGFSWMWSQASSNAFFRRKLNWQSEILTIDEAFKAFEEFFGAEYPRTYNDDFFVGDGFIDKDELMKKFEYFVNANKGTLDVPYPMAWGFSDLVCVSKEKYKIFAKYCGVFAAMDMFVEIAIPTAIVLTCAREKVSTILDIDYESGMFDENVEERFLIDCDSSYSKLLEFWKGKHLFLHPIKLSKWEV